VNIRGNSTKSLRATLKRETIRLANSHPEFGRGKIYSLLEELHGPDLPVKERTIGNWISKSKDEKQFPLKMWKRWSATSDQQARESDLMALDSIARIFRKRPLYLHEARWASRLLLDIHGVEPISQFILIEEYGHREVEAYS